MVVVMVVGKTLAVTLEPTLHLYTGHTASLSLTDCGQSPMLRDH